MSSPYATHICSICNQRVGIDHNHRWDKVEARCKHGVYPLTCTTCQEPGDYSRHVGRVWVKPEYITELLGFSDGLLLQHIPINFERDMVGFVIQHPDMPEVTPGSTYLDMKYEYKITSVKRTTFQGIISPIEEVTIIAVRKDFC